MLNKIKDNYGSRKKFKRIGRGMSSGKGKTSGRGGKGQTARSGVALNGFEGGQMPLYRRLPKRGFNQFGRISYEVLNLDDIQALIEAKRLPTDYISIQNLRDAGVFKGKKAVIKLLGTGELKEKITIEMHAISSKAKVVVEKAGASIVIVQPESSMGHELEAVADVEPEVKKPVAKKVSKTKKA
ncbi:MAG: ribosomal protein [Candidatus Midichloriaceae bacterium]|jgi:large subunit ribosomal protein L15|nr:ribosomal protein [Candidatus Midichloriaceae bacterium]